MHPSISARLTAKKRDFTGLISYQMLCPTKEMEVSVETEYLVYRKADDFESRFRAIVVN